MICFSCTKDKMAIKPTKKEFWMCANCKHCRLIVFFMERDSDTFLRNYGFLSKIPEWEDLETRDIITKAEKGRIELKDQYPCISCLNTKTKISKCNMKPGKATKVSVRCFSCMTTMFISPKYIYRLLMLLED